MTKNSHINNTSFIFSLQFWAWLLLIAAFVFGHWSKIEQRSFFPLVHSDESQNASITDAGEESNPDIVVYANGVGYSSPFIMTLELVAKDNGTFINRLNLIVHRETPRYFRLLLKAGFFQQYIGKEVNDAYRMHRDIDNVTGASISSKSMNFAIADAIEYQVPQALKDLKPQRKDTDSPSIELASETSSLSFSKVSQKLKSEWYLAEILIALLLLWAILDCFFRFKFVKKLSSLAPVFVVLIMGLYLDSSISLSTFSGLLLGYFPDFSVFPSWWLLILSVLICLFVFGRNIYCYRLCPFQALETVLRKVTKLRMSINPSLAKKAHKIALGLTWLALMVSFISANPLVGSYEPFSAVFSLDAQGSYLIIAILAVLAVVLYPGFWCRIFCPVGACLDESLKLRKKAIRKVEQQVIHIQNYSKADKAGAKQ